MKESKAITIITIILLIIGLIFLYLALFSAEFNFYKSELKINELKITEKLSYEPNKDYHTIYRNFNQIETKLTSYPEKNSNGISLLDLNCEAGTAYLKDFANKCYSFPIKQSQCLSYTEKNEYGCTFGYETGFKKGKDYEILANYELNPANLFKINNNYYIKFVAYSKDRHKTLIKGKNFIIEGDAISKKIYLPKDDVIIYIHYTKKEMQNYNIISQSEFLFDANYLQNLLIILLALFPSFSLFMVWYFYGREKSYLDVPKELSSYPKDRKGWEVAAYFHPPFSIIDKEFFSAILLDLYRRKLIDLKLKNKEVYIKINENPPKFVNKVKYPQIDEIELELLSIIKALKEKAAEKYLYEEYVNLKALNSYPLRFFMQTKLKNLQNNVEKTGKEYLDSKGLTIISTLSIISLIAVLFLTKNTFLTIFYFIILIFPSIIYRKSALLTSFKDFYYQEYQQWQAFKKYLSKSYSIQNMPHEAVILWEQYLVYGAALGEAKKVLKELKQANLISSEDYILYNTTISRSSAHFSSASGSQGRGFAGGAGGGVGGGGGGGR